MFKEIFESFQNLTPILWVSQIAGLLGLITIGIAYLFEKKRFLAIATLAFVFFVIEQVCAELYSNLIVSSVCLVRNLVMFILLAKFNKELPKYMVVAFIAIMWIGVILYMAVSHTFDQWDNYLPPAIVTMSGITQNNKNEYVVKVGATLHETGFLVYYLVYMLPVSIFRQVILIVAAIIGLIILINKNVNKKKDDEIEGVS